MAVDSKPSGEHTGTPALSTGPASLRPAKSDAIRTLRYDFQVDGGEDFLEDMSWQPFTSLKKRKTPIRPRPPSGQDEQAPAAPAPAGRTGTDGKSGR
jgi:hypothetical protein